ncbi:unnamed protein product [Echinostoma caproni]|uniref:Uncharacterized protein n=1 Tax=Echinostoma caproni TaxID=27848 RepID=A0A183A8D2_9TREM|nr:unnamed protein product [Echinostoma caproni]
MEGGTKRAPSSERIKDMADSTRCADVAAGSTSRDNVDCHSKRTNRQLQPNGQSASSQKEIHRTPQLWCPTLTSELSINVSRAMIGQTSQYGTRKKGKRTGHV